MNSVKQNWDRIAKPLFEILLKRDIVYTEAGHGKWLPIKQAYFDLQPASETKDLLHKVLLAANFPVAFVPCHITENIIRYLSVKEITPHLTREVLKQSPNCYKKLERPEKILLLQFCLSDCQPHKLCGLELMPLSNGTFDVFSNKAEIVYIASPEHPKELLPGLQHRFLDEKMSVNVLQRLNDVATQGRTHSLLQSWNTFLLFSYHRRL